MNLSKLANSHLCNIGAVTLACCLSTIVFWQERYCDYSNTTWSTSQYGLGADPSRFLLQAKWLTEGYGFREVSENGAYCTSLPPGQPIVLAIMLSVTKDLDWLRILQATFPLLSGILIYFALSETRLFALFSALLIAASPWQNALATCHMSESTSTLFVSLSVFLMAMLLDQRSRCDRDAQESIRENMFGYEGKARWAPLLATIFGFSCFAAIITSPGLVFSMSLLCLSAIIANCSRRLLSVCIAIGFITPLAIWQYHCVNALGKPVMTLLTPLDAKYLKEKEWIRTWAATPEEALLAYNVFDWNIDGDFSKVPAHAFSNDTEKQTILTAYDSFIQAKKEGRNVSEYNKLRIETLEKVTANRIDKNKFGYLVRLPLQRGVLCWLNQQPVNHLGHDSLELSARLLPWNLLHDLQQFGLKRSVLRSLRGTVGVFTSIAHFGTLFLIAYACYLGLCNKFFTIPLILSVLLFTYMHGFAGPEPRRNLPFLPLLFAIPILTNLLTPSTRTIASYLQSCLANLTTEKIR
jgi:hypothetical protein